MLLREFVKNLREKKGWKQVDLAKKLGVSQNYISKIELGLALPRSRTFKDKLVRTFEVADQRLFESYAESKLDIEEARAYQQALHRVFVAEKRDELLSAAERSLLSHYAKLTKKERGEVMAFLKFKANGG